jgi:hypothetical protein
VPIGGKGGLAEQASTGRHVSTSGSGHRWARGVPRAHLADPWPPFADRSGQLAYVTFVHEPLLHSTGVP